MSDIVKLKVGA